ncbi:MAG TPA: hypothetical protein VFE62_22815 [Gemmataceae bacterium]|nr:hypothetical protein [Gemmataceae bacterium]
MRIWATFFGIIALLVLARPASAQFSTTMSSAMSGGSGTTTNTTGFFSQLMGKPSFVAFSNRTTVPTANFLSGLPTMPSPYTTLTGQFTTGTSPGAVMLMSSAPSRQPTPPTQKKSMFSFFK